MYKLTPRMLNAQVRVSPHAQNPKQKQIGYKREKSIGTNFPTVTLYWPERCPIGPQLSSAATCAELALPTLRSWESFNAG